jgi:diguanylate cyclase (GGDEF)-like protein/PAS domain S-box-containing protein
MLDGLANLSIRTKLLLNSILTTVLVVGMLLVLQANIRESEKQAAWVSHTNQVIANTDELLLQLVNMQTGVRGFLLIGDQSLLSPYEASVDRYREVRQELTSLVDDNPEQTARLHEIDSAAQQWHTNVLERALVLVQSGQADPTNLSTAIAIIHAGAPEFDLIRTHIAEFRRVETDLLRGRVASAQAAHDNLNSTLMVGVPVTLAVSFLLSIFLANGIARRIGVVARAAVQMQQDQTAAYGDLPLGRDEVGRLAEAFHSMTATIRTHTAAQARTEAALRESETHFRLLAENATDLIVRYSPGGSFLYVSPNCVQLLGYTPNELIGRTVAELVHPADVAVFQREFTERLNPEEAGAYTWRCRTKSEHYLWLESTSRVVRDVATDAIVEIQASLRDISERKQAELALRESEEKYRSVINNIKEVVFQTDVNGCWTLLNPVWTEIMGWSVDESLASNFINYVHADDHKRFLHFFRTSIDGQKDAFRFEARYCTKSNDIRWMDIHMHAVVDETGNVIGTSGTLSDVTQRKQAEAQIEQFNAQLTAQVIELEHHMRELSLLNDMSDMLQACLAPDEAYAVIASAMYQLFPNESGALAILKSSQNLLEVVTKWGEYDDSEAVFQPDDCWALRRGRMHQVNEQRAGTICRHVDRNNVVSYLCIPLVARGETLGVLHLCERAPGSLTPTKQRLAQTVAAQIELALASLRLQETLRNQSIRDPLTSLFNRRYMEESVEREFRRAIRHEQPLSVIMLDIDHFKRFNDTFGHDAGDTLLREVANLLQTYVRGDDIVCRFGGEEFTIVMLNASAEIAMTRAEDIRNGIKHLNVRHLRQPLGPITISCGVATFPEHGADAASVIHRADAALYRAKNEGRDRVMQA